MATSASPRPGFLARQLARLQARRGQRLFDEARSPAGPRHGGSMLIQIVCWAILATTPVFLGLGIIVLVYAGRSPLAWGLGLLLLLLAWLLRPLPARVRGVSADPARHPVLFAVVDQVAKELGTAPPRIIVLTDELNAAVYTVGWSGIRVLEVGLPLFGVLDASGRVAVLGHEMAHFAADDPARSRVFAWTWNTIVGWADLTAPEYHQGGLANSLADGFTTLVLGLVSAVPRTVAHLLTWAVFSDHLRAEYRADVLGAEVSGTEAFVRAMRTVQVGAAVFDRAVGQVALGTTDAPVVEQLQREIAAFPLSERDAIEAAEILTGSQLVWTHPPFGWRIQVLLAQPRDVGLVLDDATAARLESELAQHYPAVSRRLADAYRWAIS